MARRQRPKVKIATDIAKAQGTGGVQSLQANAHIDYWLYPAIAIACFVTNLLLTTRGWNLPILDAHAFRQTQTALTSYWFVQEGFKLDYITPVLGPPWEIPLEFPLYQWIAAALHQVSGESAH